MPTVSDTEIIVVTDVPLQSLNSTLYQSRDEKGQPDGYAALGSDGKIPDAQLPPPSGAVQSVNGQIGIINLTATDVGAIDVSEKGVPNGVASLDGTGKVPSSQLPPDTEFSGATDDTGALVVTLTSNWGIDPNGIPYYDSAGADPADTAWPSVDVDGSFVLTQLAGGTA